MKNYKVKINGKVFNVTLEAVEEVNGSIAKKEVKNEEEKEIKSEVEGKDVLAPIQGNVLDVLVKKGQKVKRGDVLLLIEAMKLENEVNAPIDGEIVDVLVQKGQTVVNNELLMKIR